MKTPERKLGRGLGALLPKRDAVEPERADQNAAPAEATPAEAGRHREVAVDQIHPNPRQPREHFREDALQGLAASIRAQGVLQPLLVRAAGDGFELVAGERRLRASRLAGLATVPVVIVDLADEQLLEAALVENLQREDLNVLEVAYAYRRLLDEHGLTHEQVAARVGVSRGQVTNMLRLLDLPEPVQAQLLGGELQMGHARALLSLSSGARMLQLARRIGTEGLSVRETERIVKQDQATPARGPSGSRPAAKPKDPVLEDWEHQLRQLFGTKVRIQDRNGKGEIAIEYYSAADFGRIVGIMGLDAEDDGSA